MKSLKIWNIVDEISCIEGVSQPNTFLLPPIARPCGLQTAFPWNQRLSEHNHLLPDGPTGGQQWLSSRAPSRDECQLHGPAIGGLRRSAQQTRSTHVFFLQRVRERSLSDKLWLCLQQLEIKSPVFFSVRVDKTSKLLNSILTNIVHNESRYIVKDFYQLKRFMS